MESLVTVKCTRCNLEQPPSERCKGCRELFSVHFCPQCNLYCDRAAFHCDECNFCHPGCSDDWKHCALCGACVSSVSWEKHTLFHKENPSASNIKSDGNCPICLNELHKPLTVMGCGHCMHSECFKEYIKYHSVCPLCSKSLLENRGKNEELRSSLINREIPEEWVDVRVTIMCHECHHRSIVQYDGADGWYCCAECESFNTRML